MDIETYQHKEVTIAGGDSKSSNITEMNIGNGHTHPTPLILIFTIAIVAMVALIVGAIVVIVLDG
eukprot:CAMPEP_0170823022 /NCGR_PEP_ID=MMETSP0733-20121128/44243_1 /TAXON_ID=186038 /ORGANISM="Fragilariopsis kerguelensis, Strain L26-C5" /LENGTH=64 /DNA_ID=CAMNT_0011185565 /DNA_START=89 /DNA_END=283 /DNA_ORIENTATION=+